MRVPRFEPEHVQPVPAMDLPYCLISSARIGCARNGSGVSIVLQWLSISIRVHIDRVASGQNLTWHWNEPSYGGHTFLGHPRKAQKQICLTSGWRDSLTNHVEDV